MKKRLLWKLCGCLAVGTVALFWAINSLSLHAEQQMSFIAPQHQQTLLEYARHAEALHLAGDEAALAAWLVDLQATENTWAAVVVSTIQPLAGSELSAQFLEGFRLGRKVSWKIHLYFEENPIMDVTFADGQSHFLITLPQRMRPGAYWQQARLFLQIALPLVLLVILSVVLYRQLMIPLRKLEVATRQFSEGRFDVRVSAFLGNRKDELAALASTFDCMAERTGQLIQTQRQLIADLSHELRTPLTRMDMALDCAARGSLSFHSLEEDTWALGEDTLARIRRECGIMRTLVEDTLTLAWLENEQPRLEHENLDMTDLLDSIVDDARFEFPAHRIVTRFPAQAPLAGSSHRALGQAVENILRNGLNHTPAGGQVELTLSARNGGFQLTVADEGEGVPEAHLDNIFLPFFRLQRNGGNPGHASERAVEGFGLGLALARRQVEAVGGTLYARNRAAGGLEMVLDLARILHK